MDNKGILSETSSASGSTTMSLPPPSLRRRFTNTVQNSWKSYNNLKRKYFSAYDSELRHFVHTSKFHGPLRVYKSEHFVSLFWIIAMLGSATILVLQLRSIIHNYHSSPVDSNLAFEVRDDGAPFPQVTFCNFNPVRKTFLEEINRTMPLSEELINYYFQSNVEMQALIGNIEESSLRRGEEEYRNFLSTYDPTMTVDNFFARGGFECSDLFMICSFGGRKFDCCQFAEPVITPLGKCFTLDLPGKGKPWMVNQLAAGEPNGLQVILDVRKEEVFATSGEEADPVFTNSMDNGYRYYIHPPNTTPFVASDGYTVSPSTKVSSSMTAQSRVLLDKKNWGDCIADWPNGYNTTLAYSAGVCQLLCKATHYKRVCGCVPYNYNVEHDPHSCTPLEMFECMQRSSLPFANDHSVDNILECNECENECESSEYTTFNSYTMGFTTGAIKWLHEQNVSWTEQHISENFMIVSVFYRDLTHTQFNQAKGDSVSGMLGDIGSNLGMCFGISIITLVECVLLPLKILWIFLSSDRRRYLAEKFHRSHTREHDIDKVIEMYKNKKDQPDGEDPNTQTTIGKMRNFASTWANRIFVSQDLEPEPGTQYTAVRNPFYNQRFRRDSSSEDSESDDTEYQTTIQSLANTVAATMRRQDASTIFENGEESQNGEGEMLDMKLEKDPENPGGFIAVFPNLPDASSSDSDSDDLQQGTVNTDTQLTINKDMLNPALHKRR